MLSFKLLKVELNYSSIVQDTHQAKGNIMRHFFRNHQESVCYMYLADCIVDVFILDGCDLQNREY